MACTRRLAPLGSALVLASLALPVTTRADGPVPEVSFADSVRRGPPERPFVFLQDPSTPGQGMASVSYAYGLGSGIGADRPLPVNMASASGSHTLAAGFGLTGSVAPFVSASFADLGATTTASSVAAGVAWQVTRPWAPLHLTISAAGVHDGASSANGVQAVAAASLDLGRVRLAANLRADRMIAPGRDRLDTFFLAGVTTRLGHGLRVGVEYVGQDLEGFVAADAEGGARQSVGPTVALDLDGGRYQVAVGAGFGVGPRSPEALVRGVFAFNL